MKWSRVVVAAVLLTPQPAHAFLGLLRRVGVLEDEVEEINTDLTAVQEGFTEIETDFTSLSDSLTETVEGISTECATCSDAPNVTTIIVEQTVNFASGSKIGTNADGPTGVTIEDTSGLRLTGPSNGGGGGRHRHLQQDHVPGQRIAFGETERCTMGVLEEGGIGVKDPDGLVILNPDPDGATPLGFGPTGECFIQVDPQGPAGMQIHDVDSVRIMAPAIKFGETDNCTISANEDDGMTLKDVIGVRIMNPVPGPSTLFLGDDDQCTIGIDPDRGSGIRVTDPSGLRLIGPRLIFGESDNCTIGADEDGMTFRDICVRVENPDPQGPAKLIIGPSEECRLEVDPSTRLGLQVYEPNGVRLMDNPTIFFGPTDDCSFGVGGGTGSGLGGLVAKDPRGFRLLTPSTRGNVSLFFGPTDECAIGVDPAGPPGLQLRDPSGVRVLDGLNITFGPTADCRIFADDELGLGLSDIRGVRIINPREDAPVRLLFGDTEDCRLEVDPTGELSGLQLHDKGGVRIMTPPLLFGQTDQCSINADANGMALRDVSGVRIENPDGGAARLIIGPSEECRLEVDPSTRLGLQVYEPNGVRLMDNPTIFFGPSNNCSIGAGGGGVFVSDPRGLRLLNPDQNLPARLSFGETNACRLEVDPAGPPGIQIHDVDSVRVMAPAIKFGETENCAILANATDGMTLKDVLVRVRNPNPGDPSTLVFGVGDECTIGIDPNGLGGLQLSDPRGIRIRGSPPRIIFGDDPDDLCTVGLDTDADGNIQPGVVVRDIRGFRIRNPKSNIFDTGDHGRDSTLFFGDDDQCTIGIDPDRGSGIRVSDPRGLRLIGPQIAFGESDNCTIGVDDDGMTLRDIRVRVENPDPRGPARLIIGPREECRLEVDPSTRLGLQVYEPHGLRLMDNPTIFFGPSNNCSIGAGGGGVVVSDPRGLRIVTPEADGTARLSFGPNNDCTISVDPTGQTGGGIRVSDPNGARIINPDQNLPARLLFGETNACRLEVDPAGPPGIQIHDVDSVRVMAPAIKFGETENCAILANATDGMTLKDVRVRVRNPNPEDPSTLVFGVGNECTIGIDPNGARGLQLSDPGGIRIRGSPPRIIFGDDPDDLCTVGLDVDAATGEVKPGVVVKDIGGFRIRNPIAGGGTLLFGDNDECTIGVDPTLTGISVSDPNGLRLRGSGQNGQTLLFGPTDECTIGVDPDGGMVFKDVRGFTMEAPDLNGDGIPDRTVVTIRGDLFVEGQINPTQGRHLKESSVRTIGDALMKVNSLRGVYYDLKEEHGGASDLGLLPEEVAKIVPQAVHYEADGTTAVSVKHEKLVALTVEAIKEQKEKQEKENEDLKKQIKDLQEENKAFRAELEALKKMIARL